MRHLPHAHSAGLKAQPPHYAYESHWYYQFQLIVVSGGVLHFEREGAEAALYPGSAAILRAGSAFRLYTRDEGYSGVCFIDTNPRTEIFRGSAQTLLLAPRLRSIAETLELEGKAPQPGSRDIMLGLGLTLAWQTVRLIETREASGSDSDYARHSAVRAKEALDLALHSSQGARELLSGTGLSYRQVSRYFNAVYGLSPKQYQLKAKIREAERLLRETRIPVTAVGYELGFSSSQHFATRFLAETGRTPSAFRQTP